MKKALLLLLLSSSLMIAQNTCESKEETFDDFNSITKCAIVSTEIEKPEKARQITLKVPAYKTRYLKKRITQSKAKATSSETLNTPNVSITNHKTEISNYLALKENKAINNIAISTNTISPKKVKQTFEFKNITEIPTFEACKTEKGNKKLGCFNTQIGKHLENHFNYPQEAIDNEIEGKVWVSFIIDENGLVNDIKTTGSEGAEILNDEASRVVSELPKFLPGKKDGKKVAVKYGFPITFSL